MVQETTREVEKNSDVLLIIEVQNTIRPLLHVIALAFQPTADLVTLLLINPNTRGTVASLRELVQRKDAGQTAAVVSTLQKALRRINSKEIVWVLSGNDFSLNLNDSNNPAFLVLGNSPILSSTFSPV